MRHSARFECLVRRFSQDRLSGHRVSTSTDHLLRKGKSPKINIIQCVARLRSTPPFGALLHAMQGTMQTITKVALTDPPRSTTLSSYFPIPKSGPITALANSFPIPPKSPGRQAMRPPSRRSQAVPRLTPNVSFKSIMSRGSLTEESISLPEPPPSKDTLT